MILDTNALSDAAEEHPGIVAVLSSAPELALPVIVIGEYRFGIAHSRKRTEYERWFDELVSRCKVLEVDEQTANYYAAIGAELKGVGRPIPANDLWIAALCRQHALPILSRDKHFDAVSGIQRLDW